MRARQATIELLTEYYDALEAKDVARYSAYYADDMTVTFANAPRLDGAPAFLEALSGMLAQVRSIHHDVVQAWEEDDGRVIFESVGTWTLRDGTQLVVPACSVCTMAGGKFTDQHIYVDNAPLFAALADGE